MISILSKTKHAYALLVTTFILALILRVSQLNNLPRFLHQDEIMNGYVGRFILENGNDLYGNPWPVLYFDNFGDYPNVIPMYFSGISVYLFGFTPFGVRLPVAIMGSLAVFPMYGISYLVFRQRKISLLCAFLLSIMPWHVVLSRATAENISASTLFLSALYILILGLKKNTPYVVLSSIPFFLFTYLLYPSFRIIIPLSLLPSVLLTQSIPIKKVLIIGFGLCLFLTTLIGRTNWGSARFKQTSVFHFNNQVNNLADHFSITSDKQFIISTRLFNNKPILYVREILHQYLSYFSPTFLFSVGGHPDRYLVPSQGLLYISLGMILAAALISDSISSQKTILLSKVQKPYFWYTIYILLLSPLPAALTLDEIPNVHRSALLGIMMIFLVGYSFIKAERLLLFKHKIVFWILSILFLESMYFFHQYVVQSPAAEASARYDQRSILINHVIRIQAEYDAIILPREIFPIYYLFYSHNLDKSLAGKFSKNLYIAQVGKIHFIDNDCPSEERKLPIQGKTIIVDLHRCETKPGYKLLDIVRHQNGSDAYKLLLPLSRE